MPAPRPTPLETYHWRTITEADIPALEALDAACLRSDGPASVNPTPHLELIENLHVGTICATPAERDDCLVAAGWVRLSGSLALLGGKVHPDHRRRGLGTHLLRWCQEQAPELGRPLDFVIINEALTEGSEALYHKEGFLLDFGELWMQRDLRGDLPAAERDYTTAPWRQENARAFFDTYEEAFRERFDPRFPAPVAERWISEYEGDPEFRPDLSLLALAGGAPVGFITTGITHIDQLGKTVGWISQVGTHPMWRKRGVAAWLIATTLEAYWREGLDTAGLHVNFNNAAAIELYSRLGFEVMGRRAKYTKPSALAPNSEG